MQRQVSNLVTLQRGTAALRTLRTPSGAHPNKLRKLVSIFYQCARTKQKTKMAASEVEDSELPDEIISSLQDFYHSVNAVEETLDPLLTKSSEEIHEKVRRTVKTML